MTALNGDVIEVRHVFIATVEATGAIRIGIGDIGPNDPVDSNVPLFQQPGLVSLFSVPEPGKAAGEVLVWKTSGADVAFAGRDVRTMEVAGNLKMGETCVYAAGSRAQTLYKLDGSIVNMTTSDNTRDGTTVFEKTSPQGWYVQTPWGTIRFDATGFHVLHNSGARFDIGAIGGLPAPLNAISSYAAMQAGSVSLEGNTVSAGGIDHAGLNAALLVYIGALQTAIAVGLAATGGTTSSAAGTAFTAAMTSALAALTTAVTPIPVP